MKFKTAFQEKYIKLTDFTAYKTAVENYARKSIRVNTLKFPVYKVKKSLLQDDWLLEKVPWCKEGFYIEHKSGRRDIGNTKQHEEGMFFSQVSPSMLPAQLLDLKRRNLVLDLCAAPGGKTQHIACLLNNTGSIIANDNNTFRKKILEKNMQRCGVKNVTLSVQRAERFIHGKQFDAILVDAPCTGSGLIKGDIARTKKLLKEWNPKITKKYAAIQEKILEHAWTLLKSNRRLVYATCSLEPEEDELLIQKFLKNHDDCQLVNPPKNIQSSHKEFIKIWPQYYNTHGFFIATLKKQ